MGEDVAALVLAGGASTRMGRDKALLRLPDGRTALAWVLDAAGCVAPVVLLGVDTPEHAARLRGETAIGDLPVLYDPLPGMGPLVALAGALGQAGAPLLLALATDTPLIRPALLRMLLTAARANPDDDAVVPRVGGVAQPLHALYRARVGPTAVALVGQGRGSLRSLLRDLAARVRYLDERELRMADPDLRSFQGANTPEEWAVLLTYAAVALSERPNAATEASGGDAARAGVGDR